MSDVYRVALIGDSLSEPFDEPVAASWPELLAHRWFDAGYRVVVSNFADSGRNTGHFLADQVPLAIADDPDLVIVGTAGNDRGDGISEAQTQANLEEIVDDLRAAGIERIVLWSPWFINWPDETGDVVDPTGGHAGQVLAYAQAWRAMSAAAATRGVPHADPFVWFQQRLIDGDNVVGSADWHDDVDDPHPNDLGQVLLTDWWEEVLPASHIPDRCLRPALGATMNPANVTIPRYPICAAVTAPISGSPATIASLLDSAITALDDYAAASRAIVQVDIQSQGANGLLVYTHQGTTGAGSWKIASGEWKSIPGCNLQTMKIASQHAGNTEATVIIIYLAP